MVLILFFGFVAFATLLEGSFFGALQGDSVQRRLDLNDEAVPNFEDNFNDGAGPNFQSEVSDGAGPNFEDNPDYDPDGEEYERLKKCEKAYSPRTCKKLLRILPFLCARALLIKIGATVFWTIAALALCQNKWSKAANQVKLVSTSRRYADFPSLWGCCEDPEVFVYSWFCPAYPTAQTAHAAGLAEFWNTALAVLVVQAIDMFTTGCCLFTGARLYQRVTLRKHEGMPEALCMDCLAVTCCPCCALTQQSIYIKQCLNFEAGAALVGEPVLLRSEQQPYNCC